MKDFRFREIRQRAWLTRTQRDKQGNFLFPTVGSTREFLILDIDTVRVRFQSSTREARTDDSQAAPAAETTKEKVVLLLEDRQTGEEYLRGISPVWSDFFKRHGFDRASEIIGKVLTVECYKTGSAQPPFNIGLRPIDIRDQLVSSTDPIEAGFEAKSREIDRHRR